MSELIKINTPELEQLDNSKASWIRDTFVPMADLIAEYDASFQEIATQAAVEITPEVTKKAGDLRKQIAKIRIETERKRKELKQEFLLAGRAIDGVANIFKMAVSDKEKVLLEIERFYQIQEEQRLQKLQQERVNQLSTYVADANERDLASMEEDVWQAYLSAKKQAYEDRIQAEKQAEMQRIEKEKQAKAEQERIRKENEKLKKEREALLKKQEQERLQRQKKEKAKALLEQKRIEKEQAERKRLAEIEAKKQAEIQARLDAERKESERLQAELRAKEQAEQQRLAQLEADKQAELAKGDTEKVQDLISELKDLQKRYTFEAKANKKMYVEVKFALDKAISIINEKSVTNIKEVA